MLIKVGREVNVEIRRFTERSINSMGASAQLAQPPVVPVGEIYATIFV